ncbi:MAG: aldo/keto reductase [Agathobacter sp.]|jgi:predicted aldo/keto reductase-like oxidoreductase|nr:aldo/keto reductase [Agathobacter sp.]
MDNTFTEIKKNFGFGCMRLPMVDGEVDMEQFKQMVDLFLEEGFNYFDTAHGYLDGKSELALREGLTSRYPRDRYLLVNKLTSMYFHKEEEIRPFFENQLKWCGVDYFDVYLMHAQNAAEFEKYKKCHAYETALQLKEEGRIRHFGISFHDKAVVLDQILTEYPQVEIVQIQFNYLDYEDPSVEARKVYEVCRKHNKPVLVMEPVKGGSLVKLPEDAQKIFDDLNAQEGTQMSNASYAIRYAAGFDGMKVVLSGMSDLQQMKDNLSYMKEFQPLNAKEKDAVAKVVEVFHGLDMIPCTACHYCVDENHCPKHIRIPDVFACLNSKKAFNDWNMDFFYSSVLTANGSGKASECIGCGGCERVCPQHLEIRKLLGDVAATFEKKAE